MACPFCRGSLDPSEERVHCRSCSRSFPVYVGIPDFRPQDGPSGAWEAEKKILPLMVEQFGEASAADLLETMLVNLHSKTERELKKLRDYYLLGTESRGRHRIKLVELLCRRSRKSPQFSRSLEIGCGTGAHLLELAKKGPAVGIDPNLLHLIIAKKHIESLGAQATVACAVGENLPFPDASFSVVHFVHTLEHFQDQPRGLAEVARMLKPDGVAVFDIPNRFSLWREPHTKLWGIGFLPRRFTELSRLKNRSLPSTRRLAREAFRGHYQIHSMMVRFEVPGYERSALIRAIAALLRVTEKIPVVGWVVRFFQPGFEVVAWKPEQGVR